MNPLTVNPTLKLALIPVQDLHMNSSTLSTSHIVTRCVLWVFGGLFGVNPHWECIIVRRSSALLLTAVAHLRVSHGPDRDSNPGHTLRQAD